MSDFYQLSAKDINGSEVDFSRYQGKVCLVVNVASYCGYTPQYEKLQRIHEQDKERGLAVLGFPCNQFAEEEPGTEEEIREFCSSTYNVTFDMFAKIKVKGKDKHSVYKFLTGGQNPEGRHEVRWNFQKYVINCEGKIAGTFDPKIEPDDKRVLKVIEKALLK